MTARNILALSLAALVAVALGACGGDGSSTPSDTATEDMVPVDSTDTWHPDTTPTDTTPTDTTPPDTTPTDTYHEPDATTSGEVGDPCYSATQCSAVPGAGRLCLTTVGGVLSFPGGYCSAVCTSGADCGPGAACVDLYGIDQYCLDECSVPADCRTSEGYQCTTLPSVTGGPYCVPPSPDTDATTDY